MKRSKRLTKRERKALDPVRKTAPTPQDSHIHCIRCGRHLNPEEFSSTPASATYVLCDHGSRFPSCVSCLVESEKLVATHDKSGQPVKTAPAWH